MRLSTADIVLILDTSSSVLVDPRGRPELPPLLLPHKHVLFLNLLCLFFNVAEIETSVHRRIIVTAL